MTWLLALAGAVGGLIKSVRDDWRLFQSARRSMILENRER